MRYLAPNVDAERYCATIESASRRPHDLPEVIVVSRQQLGLIVAGYESLLEAVQPWTECLIRPYTVVMLVQMVCAAVHYVRSCDRDR
jgi:hypothetical protein